MSKLTVRIDGIKMVPHKRHVFSGGEVHVNVNHYPHKAHSIHIDAKIKDSEALIELVLLAEALTGKYPEVENKGVRFTYMPYARQDRRCAEGDAVSSYVFARTILKELYEMRFLLSTVDIHSKVGLSVMRNGANAFTIDNLEMYEIIQLNQASLILKDRYVVSPDKGARLDVKKVVTQFEDKCLGMIECSKTRDPQTGELSGFEVHCDDIEGHDVIIMDDICDGGGTFLGLAEELRKKGCGDITLYVTHGIFSKGLDVFDSVFSKIHTTNSFYEETSHWHSDYLFIDVLNV